MKKLFMFSLLISALVRGVWAIEPIYAEAYKPIVRNLIAGNMPALQAAIAATQEGTNVSGKQMYAVAHDKHYMRSAYSIEQAPKGAVAVLPITGPIMKYDYCGSTGTKTMAEMVRQINQAPNIAGLVVNIDSGGGEAYATKELSDEIRNLKKPTITLVDGFACSAAYWIGSATSEVVLSSAADVVGSIGTYVTLLDDKEFYESKGIKIHEIYASKSNNKNATHREALQGNYDPIIQEMIDPVNELFLQAVSKHRAASTLADDALSGKTYMGKKAIKAGLADTIAGMDYCIQKIKKLA